ncbi:MAG: hypothetical protein AB7T49_18340 [Oligoflexales bacterium]
MFYRQILVLGSIVTAAASLQSCSTEADIQQAEQECGEPLEEIKQQNQISDRCRAAILGLLPSSQANVESRSLTLLDQTNAGEREIVVAFTDEFGKALDLNDVLKLKISVENDGEIDDIASENVSVTAIKSTPQPDFLSLSFVSDYSGSMRDEDIRLGNELFGDLATLLSGIYESEVSIFSTTPKIQQDYTSDLANVLAGLELDSSFSRESTALYDAVGQATTRIIQRDTAARILVTSTDGAENASTEWTKSELLKQQGDYPVFKIMLGSLFSDVDELKALAGDNGVYIYAREMKYFKDNVLEVNKALSRAVTIKFPSAAGTVHISIGNQTYSIIP